MDKYWLTNENTCIDAACADPGCGLCNTDGPAFCNFCKNDFAWIDAQTCRSKDCAPGFEWKEKNLVCEDVTCKLDRCRSCEVSGIYSCDVCEAGFFFDAVKGTCELDVCQVEHCANCQGDRDTCLFCNQGYWLDGDTCIDAKCVDPNCEICLTEGPTACDICKENSFKLEKICYDVECFIPGYKFNYDIL